jgi:hypothetical protein
MEIIPKWDYVKGSFDTKNVKMHCIPKDNYGTIVLSIETPECAMTFPFAEIKLFSSELYVDFKETFDDATKLGKEIARRWNECETKL